MKTRRHALALAAALAATVLTGGAAILGLSHTPASATPPTPSVLAQQAAAPPQYEGGD
jgi:hypothetical protein